MKLTTRRVLPLVVISLVYLVLALLFAVRVPDWQTPDEPAHYNYIAQLAAGNLPVIEPGDWDQAALDAYKSARFDSVTTAQLRAIEYEDHQPPLYYALLAPVFSLTSGDLTALRITSALFGLVIIWSAWGVGLLLLPDRYWVAVGAAGFVAFQPMHLHILASVNNDALAWALVGVGLVLAIAHVKETPLFGRQVPPWLLGLIVGLGFVTKATTYFYAGVAGLAVLVRWWLDYRRKVDVARAQTFPEEARSDALQLPLPLLLRAVAAFLLPALLLGGAWWLRNISVYGFPDFLGLAAHDAVVVGQPRTQARIDALGWGGYLQELGRTTFNSFWGQFGWMALPLREAWYRVIVGGLLVALAGLIIDTLVLRRHDRVRLQPAQRAAWWLLGLTVLLAVLAYLYYNSSFQQYQGRYMFTALIPVGLWLALGVDGWRRLVVGYVAPTLNAPAHPIEGEVLSDQPASVAPMRDHSTPWRLSRLLVMFAALPFALLDLYLIWRVIPPNL
ncbi:MAG: hypothetical protein ACOCXZ_00690 [Chloroflexota bacterium]